MDTTPDNHDELSVGQTAISFKKSSSILTPAKGFMNTYDYTLNPYSGCSFGCTYCYAAFFATSLQKKTTWGYWVQVKENVIDLLRKVRPGSLNNKTIYMSSVTDPYQPAEKKLELTQGILEQLLLHQPRLVIQTRSPLITRDIQLLNQFKSLQVNMTITTDSETVRKVFEPLCPSNKVRLKAIKQVNDAGIMSCITITPLLPVENPDGFAKELLNTGIRKFIIQPFHSDKGKFVGATREAAAQLTKTMGWTEAKYLETLDTIRKYIPDIGIGKDGFKPI